MTWFGIKKAEFKPGFRDVKWGDAPAPGMSGLHEMVHFAVRNRKLVFGLGVTLFMLLFAAIGPAFARHPALEYGGNLSAAPTTHGGYWFGTTLLGQDVYAQFVTGLRLAFIVGALGGAIASIVGSPSVMQITSGMSEAADSKMASPAKAGGTKIMETLARGIGPR